MENNVRCPNMNHAKSNSPVNFCPNCGGSLKRLVLVPRCQETTHNEKRKSGDTYCVDCGKKF